MYSAEITRNNPGCFIFLLDQSGSMSLDLANTGASKAQYVADTINRTIQEIAFRCAKPGEVRDYFCITILGYGDTIGSALGDDFNGRFCIPISELAEKPSLIETRTRKMPDGVGGIVEIPTKFPIWVQPSASGGTPMCEALRQATRVASEWMSRYPKAFPPVVLNLTDGESTDGNPEEDAHKLTSLQGADGNVLLFNLHVSSDQSPPVVYPDSEEKLPNKYAKQLFRISSVLTTGMQIYAHHLGVQVSDRMRGFVFNADATSIVQFLDIGTRATRQVQER